VTLAVAGLGLAGCGDGRLSSGDFLARADAVCAAYRSAVARLPRPETFAQTAQLVDESLPLYESALRKLASLRPPPEEESATHAWLAADRRVIATMRALRAAAKRRDAPLLLAAASRVRAATSSSRAAAARLGLQICAK
jgi:hypothetical protein